MRGGESDVVKVLDFGLVKLTQDPFAVALSSDRTVAGTPLFMSPEQIVGDRMLDGRSDIYALGVVMYIALTGKPPFTADAPFEVMMSHVNDPVPAPGLICSGLPGDLEAVVLRCLAKKREDRYPNVKALGEALAACKSTSEWAPTAPMPGGPRPGWRRWKMSVSRSFPVMCADISYVVRKVSGKGEQNINSAANGTDSTAT